MNSTRKYKHLFFDLDRTLWDFDESSRETLDEIYEKYKLNQYFDSFIQFYELYHKINDILWTKYRNGEIKKEILRSLRFYNTFLEVNVKDQKLAHKVGNDYVTISPVKTNVFPYTYEALKYLKQNKYRLYIITNGFKEVQKVKMHNCGFNKYFSKLITAELCGYYKPDPRIFHYALTSVNAKKDESIMIGDDYEVDIEGAKKSGIDQVYFNPNKDELSGDSTFKITSLKQLMDIF